MHLWPILWWFLSRLAHRFRTLLGRFRSSPVLRRPKTPIETANAQELQVWKAKPKPAWVRSEVLRLKALMPDNGCRKFASTFCYLHASRGETVSKWFVAKLLTSEAEAVLRLRREIKNRVPRKVPRNLTWALDLTFLPTPDGGRRPVLGVIDHGSRACLALRELKTRRTVDILRIVLDLVEAFGRPRILRTDNESIFTSRLFRISLWILGIRHRRSAPFSPWQNGRIERMFLTLKEPIGIWKRSIEAAVHVDQGQLDLYRAWYNGVRPHQHLEGQIVPAEAWAGKKLRSSRGRHFSAWDGALTGFY